MNPKFIVSIALSFSLGGITSWLYLDGKLRDQRVAVLNSMQSNSMLKLSELHDRSQNSQLYTTKDYIHCQLITDLSDLRFALSKERKALESIEYDGVNGYQKVTADIEVVDKFIKDNFESRCALIQS